MKFRSVMCSLLLTPVFLLTSCGEPTAVAGDDRGVLRSFRYELPIPDEFEQPDTQKQVYIDADRTLTYGGKDYLKIDEIIAVSASDGLPQLDIRVAADAKFGDVVETLEGLNTRSASIWGTEEHKKFGTRVGRNSTDGLNMEFRSSTAQYDLPVTVGYAVSDDACVVALSGRQRNSGEFFDDAFVTLDGWVEEAGGVEAFFIESGKAMQVVARVQSNADTPWRCAAGAIYNVQLAGFPQVQLEVVE